MTKINIDTPPSSESIEKEKATVNLSQIKENYSYFLSSSNPRNITPPQDVVMFTPYEYYQMILPEYANCLSVQTYLKMCKIDFQIEERANAEFMSPTLSVPFIKVDNIIVAELDEVINYLHNKNINLADKLENDQKVDLNAFMSLIPNILHLTELYVSWMDKETYQTVTGPKYGCVFPFPLNWIQTSTKRQQVFKKLEIYDWSNKSLGDVLLEFEMCCEALSDRLEGNLQFFEGHDTELDACIFGHLYAILSTPLPGNYLEDVVKKFPDLLNFVEKKREIFG